MHIYIYITDHHDDIVDPAVPQLNAVATHNKLKRKICPTYSTQPFICVTLLVDSFLDKQPHLILTILLQLVEVDYYL